MADSNSRLFVSLILFWTFLTIFSIVFENYLEEPISDKITKYSVNSLESSNQIRMTWYEKLLSSVYDTLDKIPIINIFTPLLKLVTFGYSDKIPVLVSIFLQATLLFTAYVIFNVYKGSG